MGARSPHAVEEVALAVGEVIGHGFFNQNVFAWSQTGSVELRGAP